MSKLTSVFLNIANKTAKPCLLGRREQIVSILGKISVFLGIIIYGLWSFKTVEILHLFFATTASFYIGFYKQKTFPKLFKVFLLTGIIFSTFLLYTVNKILSEPIAFSLILLLISTANIIFAYYAKSILILLFGFITIFSSLAAQTYYLINLSQIKEIALFSILIFIALIFYGISKTQTKKRFKTAYLTVGILPVAAILLFLSTKKGISYLNIMLTGEPFYISLKMLFLFLLFFLVFMSLLIYLVFKNLILKKDVFFLLALFILFLILPAIQEQELINLPQNFLSYKGYVSAFLFGGFLAVGFLKFALCIKNCNHKFI